MGNQDIGVGWDVGIVAAMTVGNAVAHKHRHTVKLHPFNLNAGVAKVMYVAVQSVDIGSVEAIVMVAADKDFVLVRQVTEPVEEVDGFLLRAYHAEVTGMYHHIGLG